LPSSDPAPSPLDGRSAPCDVVVIGAGVVGCAVARRFALEGADVAVIEAGPDILSGASRANSAILHTGFDAPADSLELACVREGHAEYLSIRHRLNLPLLETGALVCAWSDDEAGRLEAINAQGLANGITALRHLGAADARATMPALAGNLKAAIEIRDEAIIDPWSAPLAYLTEALALGASFHRAARLTAAWHRDGLWQIETARGRLQAHFVINCAGLQGDRVDATLGLPPGFEIRPRKGQFAVFDKAAARAVTRIILPVPNEITKGIVVCPTVFGNVLVDPTAEEQEDRDHAGLDTATLRHLIERAGEIVPALRGMPVTATYAGLRPATEAKQYRVTLHREAAALTLGGIRSTGLSAALGIARHAWRLFSGTGLHAAMTPRAAPEGCAVPNLAEHEPRDWQAEDHGEMACHCELVTRREIEAALNGPLPPADLSGLKRRTRAGMGRCQGFYCQARLARLTEGRLAQPVAAGGKDRA